MALQAPHPFDIEYLRAQVRAEYERVAHDPEGDFHFHRGPAYAQRMLGYAAADLARVPAFAAARFAGVGNPLRIGTSADTITPLQYGETVLDHACGAGMDLLIAAQRVGTTGKAIGVDMTPAMREVAREAAQVAGLSDIVEIRPGFFEALPVEDNSVDVVISNGVVNLAPDKRQVFKEIVRVLKPGGRLFLADVIVQRELTHEARSNPDLWAACVGGALVESELYELAASCGLQQGQIMQRFNCFYDTSAESKVAKDLFIHGVNFYARKPGPSN